MPPPKGKQVFYTLNIGGNVLDVTGRKMTPAGYIALCIKDHPNSDKLNGYIFEHRVVMEIHLGRYLKANEVVHHINHVKHDNRLRNLEVMDHTEHTIMHHTGSKRSNESKRKISTKAKERFKDKRNHPFYKDIDKDELLEVVQKHGPTKAAVHFDVSRNTIYNKLKHIKEGSI